MNQLLLRGFLVLFVGCLAGSRVAVYYLRRQNPAFLREAGEHAKASPRVVVQTGNLLGEEYRFNPTDLTKDSLPFTIQLKDERATLVLQGWAHRQPPDSWTVRKVDTLVVKR